MGRTAIDPRLECTKRFRGSSRHPDPEPRRVEMARYFPSLLSARPFGYHAVGIRPSSLREPVSKTATAFRPPQATNNRALSPEIASAVGAIPGVLTPNGWISIVFTRRFCKASITETESEFPLAT